MHNSGDNDGSITCEALRGSYDETPYPCTPYPQTHPSRLAVLAAIHGLKPPPVDRCRVLELGCADGSNLLPMAARLPEGRFLGIDLSPKQIQRGLAAKSDLGLENVEFVAQDLTSLCAELGAFDYILAHGVYSWVPPSVQRKVLEIIGRHLSDQGVAYVSYNTTPGWHTRQIFRDMVYRQWDQTPPASMKERLAIARSTLERLREASVSLPWPFAKVLTNELDMLLPESDEYLAHDIFECEQHPVSFREFESRLAEHDMQYLSDAEFHATLGRGLSAQAMQVVQSLSQADVDRQELMDMLLHRTFRQTLICRRAAPVDRAWQSGRLRDSHVVGEWKLENSAVGANARTYRTTRGLILQEARPFMIAVMDRLNNAYPESIPMADLCRSDPTWSADSEARVEAAVLRLYSFDAVDIHALPTGARRAISDRPVVCPYIRYQAKHGLQVANLFHNSCKLEEPDRALLPLLDGTRAIEELTSMMNNAPAILQRMAPMALLTG